MKSMYSIQPKTAENKNNNNKKMLAFQYILTLAIISKNIDKMSFSLIILSRSATNTKVRTVNLRRAGAQ